MSKSLFGSIKDKFSRNDGEKSASTRTKGSNNPYIDSLSSGSGDPFDAPPAYTATPSSLANIFPSPPLHNITNDNDPYAFLSSFDTIFIVDDSGSMQGPSWREVSAALRSITPICTAHDSDGIDLYFLNHRSGISGPNGKAKNGYYNITSSGTVNKIFSEVSPRGITPIGERLQSILKPYLASLSNPREIENIKPVNIIVITDGRPTDDPESIIVQSAKKLDELEAPPHQIGVQFFQVGNDHNAQEALRELDDDLVDQGIRDMVDTVTWDSTTSDSDKVLSADGILKVVLGAVVRRLDRKTVDASRIKRR